MVTYNLNYPANWQDFESLCFLLWRDIWGDPETHMNGRRGQSQAGVDIYGRPRFQRYYHGVQCKGKNGNYGQVLTEEEIQDECNKATSFKPSIQTLIFATTSPRDAKLQKYCRQITEARTFPFSVDLWAWDDIEEEIRYRPDIMKRFYPDIKDLAEAKGITLSHATPLSRLCAFFRRPGILNNLNTYSKALLDQLVQELALNAFSHGKASNFTIKIKGNTLECIDDGSQFDPIQLLQSQTAKRGGYETLSTGQEIFKYSYNYNTERCENIFSITFKDVPISDEHEKYQVTITSDDCFGRTESAKAAIAIFANMPKNVKTIIIDISGNFNMCLSTGYGLFDTILDNLGPGQTVKVYLPYKMIYADRLKESYIEDQRIQFIEKD